MILLSLGWKPISFLFIEHFGVSLVFFWDEFGEGDGGFLSRPCFRPWHVNFAFFPVDLGVEGSEPGISEYYAVFPQARLVKARVVPLVSALNGHFAVSLDSSCLVGCAVDVGKSDWLGQGFCLDSQSLGGPVVDEVVHRATIQQGFFDCGSFRTYSKRDCYFLYVMIHAVRSL